MADYSKITNDEFDDILLEQISALPGEQLLMIPGIYDILKEHFNNEVLDAWAEKNPRLAYPEDYEDEDDETDDED